MSKELAIMRQPGADLDALLLREPAGMRANGVHAVIGPYLIRGNEPSYGDGFQKNHVFLDQSVKTPGRLRQLGSRLLIASGAPYQNGGYPPFF
ncbi:MAG TPA: hypothetical protein VF401_01935 [Candidatus Saccharimonadales bacterium]